MSEQELEAKAEISLTGIVSEWQKIRSSVDTYKEKHFGNTADECMAFYRGPIGDDSVWDKFMDPDSRNGIGGPSVPSGGFKFVTAMGAELVQLFGPQLYHRNPNRLVTARELMAPLRSSFVPFDLEQRIDDLQFEMSQIQPQVEQAQQSQQPLDPMLEMQMSQLQQELQQLGRDQQQAERTFNRTIKKNRHDFEQRKARGQLISDVLNYTPNEFALAEHSRQAIEEALIKGGGVCWLELKEIAGGQSQLPGWTWDSIDNFWVDAAAVSWETCRYVIRKRVRWIYDVAEEFAIEVDTLKNKATLRGIREGDMVEESSDNRRKSDKDMVVYYEIYSRIGVCQNYSNVTKEAKETLGALGDNVFLAICPGVPYPLNMPADLVQKVVDYEPPTSPDGEPLTGPEDDPFQELLVRAQWPVPLWQDKRWPCAVLSFHKHDQHLYGMAHLKMGLPELKAVNWSQSFIMNKAAQLSRTIMAVHSGLEETEKASLMGNEPVVQVNYKQSSGITPDQFVTYISNPNANLSDVFAAKAMAEDAFRKRTGLSDLMYAQSGGMRSAAEAQLKDSVRNIRPDDMADRVEQWMTYMARCEALALIWLGTAEDVRPTLGEAGAELWTQLIEAEDPNMVSAELDFRIEAGSVRKPNIGQQQEAINMVIQQLGPQLLQMAQQGNVDPYNSLIREWARLNQVPDIERFMLQPPAPPPQQQGPDPAQMAAQQQAEAKQQELMMKQQLAQMQLQMKQQDAQIKQALGEQKLGLEAARGNLKLEQDQLQFQLNLQQDMERQRLRQGVAR